MQDITIVRQGPVTKVCLGQNMTVSGCESASFKVLSELESTKALEIDASGVETIEVSGIQFLLSLKKTCMQNGITFGFTQTFSSVVQNKLESWGVLNSMDCILK